MPRESALTAKRCALAVKALITNARTASPQLSGLCRVLAVVIRDVTQRDLNSVTERGSVCHPSQGMSLVVEVVVQVCRTPDKTKRTIIAILKSLRNTIVRMIMLRCSRSKEKTLVRCVLLNQNHTFRPKENRVFISLRRLFGIPMNRGTTSIGTKLNKIMFNIQDIGSFPFCSESIFYTFLYYLTNLKFSTLELIKLSF